jgi:hypothetical protein
MSTRAYGDPTALLSRQPYRDPKVRQGMYEKLKLTQASSLQLPTDSRDVRFTQQTPTFGDTKEKVLHIEFGIVYYNNLNTQQYCMFPFWDIGNAS